MTRREYCEKHNILITTFDYWRRLQKRKLMPRGRHVCNIWQGTFPDVDLAEPSSPVRLRVCPIVGTVLEGSETFLVVDDELFIVDHDS